MSSNDGKANKIKDDKELDDMKGVCNHSSHAKATLNPMVDKSRKHFIDSNVDIVIRMDSARRIQSFWRSCVTTKNIVSAFLSLDLTLNNSSMWR
jgi:hypothetical protein